MCFSPGIWRDTRRENRRKEEARKRRVLELTDDWFSHSRCPYPKIGHLDTGQLCRSSCGRGWLLYLVRMIRWWSSAKDLVSKSRHRILLIHHASYFPNSMHAYIVLIPALVSLYSPLSSSHQSIFFDIWGEGGDREIPVRPYRRGIITRHSSIGITQRTKIPRNSAIYANWPCRIIHLWTIDFVTTPLIFEIGLPCDITNLSFHIN